MPVTPTDLNRLAPGEIKAFADSLNLVAQQRKSRLTPHVTADLGYGEKGVAFTDELLEKFEAEDFDGDIAPSPPPKTVGQKRREGRFRGLTVDRMVGTRERAEKLVDPTNAVTMAMGAALQRKRDKNIIGAPGAMGGIFGDAYEVDAYNDVTTKAFPASQIIAVNEFQYYKGLADGSAAPAGTPTGLQRAKMAATRILLDKSFYGEMDDSAPIALVEQKDIEYFCTSEELLNREYTVSNDAVMQFRDRIGKEGSAYYNGMTFVKVANGALPLVPGQAAQWYVPVYYKSAILYKERPLEQTRVQPRQEYRYRWWAYYEAQHATLRREDEAVVWIKVTRL